MIEDNEGMELCPVCEALTDGSCGHLVLSYSSLDGPGGGALYESFAICVTHIHTAFKNYVLHGTKSAFLDEQLLQLAGYVEPADKREPITEEDVDYVIAENASIFEAVVLSILRKRDDLTSTLSVGTEDFATCGSDYEDFWASDAQRTAQDFAAKLIGRPTTPQPSDAG